MVGGLGRGDSITLVVIVVVLACAIRGGQMEVRADEGRRDVTNYWKLHSVAAEDIARIERPDFWLSSN